MASHEIQGPARVRFVPRREGDLRRVTAPVNSELEITEITDRMVKSGGPALLFENVDGATTPLLINIFGTHRRTRWRLGSKTSRSWRTGWRELFKMVQGPPSGLGGKLHALGELMGLARSPAEVGAARAVPGGGADGRRGRSLQDANHQVLADGRGSVHHTAPGNKPRPFVGQAERRDVPDAGV